jgi:hypothetical protein
MSFWSHRLKKNRHTGRECSCGDLREYVWRLKAGSLEFSGNQPRP